MPAKPVLNTTKSNPSKGSGQRPYDAPPVNATPIPNTNPLAGFQELFEKMKKQPVSWVNYINVQGQGGNFDLFKILKSAFIMQAIANRQLLLEFSVLSRMSEAEFQTFFEKENAILIYDLRSEDHKDSQQLFLLGDKTVLFLKKEKLGWTSVCVLTFDQVFEKSFKQMFDPKINGKDE